MLYRDLIPGRLGGAVIASHIRIEEAGPVPDLVHFHDIGFQLIFCHRGWVRVVYEDQGSPFVLNAGDCVIQPPRIRHRVLESSGDLEVIELSAPAEHLTTMDHEMELPTPVLRPDREFGGQRFRRSEARNAAWTPWRFPGFEARETGIGAATGGVAAVRVARPTGPKTEVMTSHTAGTLFMFVLSGHVLLREEGTREHALGEGDSFVIPAGVKTGLTQCGHDLQLLEVALPAKFETHIHVV
jgi:quercetin dioxygenase-like cupin family protein